MRLIDADAMMKRLEEWNTNDSMDKALYNFARIRIIEQPTIEPVRNGKWIVYVVSMLDGEDCKCSECGQTSCAPYWNFCPNCGSRMEGCEQNG